MGELEPWTAVVKKAVKNWRKQLEGLASGRLQEFWDPLGTETGNARGPVNWYRGIFRSIGWQANGIREVVDHWGGGVKDVGSFGGYVRAAVEGARQALWGDASKHHNDYQGVRKCVDEHTRLPVS